MGITLILAISLTYYVERQMFREVSLASLDYFQAATRTLPTETELKRIHPGGDRARLERALAPLLGKQNVVTIKLYDASGRLLYHSYAPEQVGRFFPDNLNLKKALAGERAMTVSDLSHPENVAERRLGVGRLLELYIPIRDSKSDNITGAYEIYISLAPFYQRLWRRRLIVWGIVLVGAFLLYAGLFIHFRRASHTIVGQSREIEGKAKDLEKTLAELKDAQAELIRSERLATVGQLAAGVAHEVGNPLGSIIGMVDLLMRSDDGPARKKEREEYLERIASEVMRLKGTIRSLLDYARPTQPHFGPLDLNKMVEKTLPLFCMQRPYRLVDVRVDLADPPPCAWGDEALVQQILLNLLLNAGQAMQGDGRLLIRTGTGDLDDPADLRCGPLTKGEGDVCVLEVRDDGPGIDSDLLPRIFEPFVTTRPSREGVGLGLATCLRLVEELRGAIEVKSRPGEGSTFRILLPLVGVTLRRPDGEETSFGQR